MMNVTEIAHDLGLLTIPDGMLLRPQDVMQLPPDKVAVVVSGTQGEPMSALSRVAVDNHKHFSVERGDTVVLSSRIIPGNEKAIFRMINHMARRGADVVYGTMNPPLHVSGHASEEELKLVLNLVRPTIFHADPRRIPAAGEACRWPSTALLGPGRDVRAGNRRDAGNRRQGARRGEKVTVGRVCIDSGSMDEVVEEIVIRDRRHLSEDGIVLPIIAINKHTGRMRRPAGDRQPRLRVQRGQRRASAGGPAGGGARRSKLRRPRNGRLGRDEGEDPRRPEAVPQQADRSAVR